MKKFRFRRRRQTKEGKAIDEALVRGDFIPVSKEEHERIAKSIEARKKDAVLNIRINQGDLDNLKLKAERLGVKYQTFIAELLHKIAHS